MHRLLRELSVGSWIQLGQDIDCEAYYDRSGTIVSINSTGNIVAIGAPNNNNGNGCRTKWSPGKNGCRTEMVAEQKR